MLTLPKKIADAIVAHAQNDHPIEACGLVGGKDGAAVKLYPMANVERSPVLYRADPSEQFKADKDMRDNGLELVAIYHSHTRSPAYPSATDVAQAYFPEAVYLIVSLQDRDAPVLRGFTIEDGKVTEVALETV